MVLTIVLNPDFIKLNSNSLRSNNKFGTRERRAVIDISGTGTFGVGGITIDLSKIRGFKEIYAATVIKSDTIQLTSNVLYRIQPGVDAANTKLSGIFYLGGDEIIAPFSINGKLIVEIIGI